MTLGDVRFQMIGPRQKIMNMKRIHAHDAHETLSIPRHAEKSVTCRQAVTRRSSDSFRAKRKRCPPWEPSRY
jgi:hypothetical protein